MPIPRPYRPEDAPALLGLFRDTIRRVNAADYSPRQIAAWSSDEIDPAAWAARFAGRFTLVADNADGSPAGFAELEANGHIDRVYVAADGLRRGVGRSLLAAILAEARRRGLPALTVEASITARPFFEAMGFAVVTSQVVTVRGVEFINYRMRMDLTRPDRWTAARERMCLDPSVVMLNTGSFGPLPVPVWERVTELRRQLAAGPTDFFVRRQPPLLWEARSRLAEFIGTDPTRLVFTANVSVAINLVAATLRLPAGGEVLLSDHEYGAMHWCWERAAIRQGLTLRTFPLPHGPSPAAIVEAVRAAISGKTRLLFLSHVTSPTGLVSPIAEVCAEARRRGVLTVIDGAHAAGMLPLDVDAIGADFYAGNCHKWLLAPSGTGFLALHPTAVDRLRPMQVSWGWHHDRRRPDERDEYGSTPRLRALEFEGTRDVCPWLAVPAAIDFQATLGWEAIRGRMAELAAHARRVLGWLPAVVPDAAMTGALTAFRVPAGTDPARLRAALWADRIEMPVIERPDGVLVRVSGHFYNTEAEIDRLAERLPAMLAASRTA